MITRNVRYIFALKTDTGIYSPTVRSEIIEISLLPAAILPFIISFDGLRVLLV